MVSIIKRGKSGAVFFTLDTLIAGLIVTVTIMLVMSIYSSRPVVEDTYHELNNFLSFLASTTMKDVRDKYQFAYDDAYEEDLELFVYQKVYKMLIEDGGDTARASVLVANLTRFVVPSHLGFEYVVNDTIIYEDNLERLDYARTSLTGRILTYYVDDSLDIHITTTNITIWS